MSGETSEAAEHVVEGAAHAAEASSSGMPQLDFSTFPNQIFWLLVALFSIYYILNRVALPRIASVLGERAGTITHDIAAAEELKSKAAEAETAYEQALTDARGEAAKIVDAAKAEIQLELDAELAKADAEIAARTAESETAIAEIREQASASVSEVARATAREIISALGTGADPAAADAAVDAVMKG